jgi:hypothetical protein
MAISERAEMLLEHMTFHVEKILMDHEACIKVYKIDPNKRIGDLNTFRYRMDCIKEELERGGA